MIGMISIQANIRRLHRRVNGCVKKHGNQGSLDGYAPAVVAQKDGGNGTK
jgi:hypothetical protein